MSEGEKKAIEILTTYKNQILDRKPFTYSFVDMQWAIGAILDLYNKEKEKNDLLVNGTFDMFKKVLDKEFKKIYINKAKIKEKIEKINKKEQEELKGTKGQDRYFIKQLYQAQKNVVQELLEEVE